MLAWRAARTAARRRGFAAGSGRPERAAVTSYRMILVKTLARFLSCAAFRYMMFLNCEWPAIDFYAAFRRQSAGCYGASGLTIQYGRIGASRGAAGCGFAAPLLRRGRLQRRGKRSARRAPTPARARRRAP